MYFEISSCYMFLCHPFSLLIYRPRFFGIRIIIITTAVNVMMRITATTPPTTNSVDSSSCTGSSKLSGRVTCRVNGRCCPDSGRLTGKITSAMLSIFGRAGATLYELQAQSVYLMSYTI